MKITLKELRELISNVVSETALPKKQVISLGVELVKSLVSDLGLKTHSQGAQFFTDQKCGGPVIVRYAYSEIIPENQKFEQQWKNLSKQMESMGWQKRTEGNGKELHQEFFSTSERGFDIEVYILRAYRKRDDEVQYSVKIQASQSMKPQPPERDGYAKWVAKTGAIYD